MDRNFAYWFGMVIGLVFLGYSIYDRSWLEIGLAVGWLAFVNIYGIVAAKLEKRKQK